MVAGRRLLPLPGATRLLVTADSGGASASCSHQRKDQLALLAAETGLRIEVMHFPPGTPKRNKTGHRLSCHITRTWRGRPLMTLDDAVAGIAATVTSKGLKCHPVRDGGDYPTGLKVPPARVRELEDRWLERSSFHGEWNYALLPAPRPAPGPEPEPEPPGRVPQRQLNQPALTGIPAGELTALAARLEARFEARLQLQYRTRHGARARAARSGAVHGNRRLDVTGYLIALRLRQHLRLPAAAAGALPGIDGGTVSHATALARELPDGARVTLPDGPPAGGIPRTPAGLLARAAAAGNPITLPENGHPIPERFRTRGQHASRDTPEPAK